MNYFLDTCVELGYVFCTDPWNDKSVKVFDETDYLHYSYCVDREFDKKYHEFLKEQKNLFYSLRDELKIENPDKLLSLDTLILKSKIIPLKRDFNENKKEKCVEIFWEFCKAKHEYDVDLKINVCKVQHLLNRISRFIRSFERGIKNRRADFERKVIYHSKRNKKYPKLLKDLENNNIHYPDYCIILDAHDLSLTENLDLEFITADNKMAINANNIIGLLNIQKFHYLKEYSFDKH